MSDEIEEHPSAMRACPQCGHRYPPEVQYCSVDGTRLSQVDSLAPNRSTGEPTPGSVLGNYRLGQRIGAGGMSLVYEAEHTRLGRRVAIKLLRCEHAANPVAVKRFFQEARAVNTIRHEHIVEITDFVEQAGGDNYYVMELLEGESLTALEQRVGPLPIERALRIAIQVCRALAAVHAAGVVHRDLKPDNIILIQRSGRSDFVKLLDFGVAKLVDDRAGKPLHQTAAGAILGTPAYMSMEQASGKPVDHRADIYSLGIILFEMLSGVRPFDADTFGGLLIQQLTVEPPGINELEELPQPVPDEIERLILQCLEKEADRRPASMDEVAERLGAVLRSLGGELPGPEPFTASAPAGRRRTTAFFLGALGLVGVALVAALWWPTGPGAAPGDGTQPAATRPATVQVAFESRPPGARVFAPGSQRTLGLTPFAAALPRSDAERVFEFQLADHRPARQRVVPNENQRVMVVLGKIPRPEAARPATSNRPGERGNSGKTSRRRRRVEPARPQAGKDGTLDPFGLD